MNVKSKPLFLIAGFIFAASFLPPAYNDSRGFNCFNFCLGVALEGPSQSPAKWLYYSAFVPANLAFIVIFALGFVRIGFHKTRFIVSALAFFHVLSWLLINLRRDDIRMLKVGYFLWLLAYGLLLAAQISSARESAPQPAPSSTDGD